MAPSLEGEAPETGPGFVCFDAGPLISFNDVQRLDLLADWFGPTAYAPSFVVAQELKRRPKQNAATIAAAWLQWVPSHPDDTQLVADLLKRFGKGHLRIRVRPKSSQRAWKLHEAIERDGRFSPLKPDEAYRSVFVEFCGLLRALHRRRGRPQWPLLLAANGLDDLLVKLLRDFKVP